MHNAAEKTITFNAGAVAGTESVEPAISREDKIEIIARHFRIIIETLGLDPSDDSLLETPHRVARMYVDEAFRGLNPDNFPRIALFPNTGYSGMLIERDINVYSYCEHHFVPIIGRAHIAYYPGRNIIGLSKIHRLVQHFSKRPQVQERLTREIGEALSDVLGHDNVGVIIEATHFCVASRGVEDTNSETVTTWFNGRFNDANEQKSFFEMIRLK